VFLARWTCVVRAALGKDVAEVHDYHDRAVRIIAASLQRRMPRYPALGFVQTWALLRPGAPFGQLLESFVLSELSRQLTWSKQPAELSHYRDHSKFEVDAVLENRSGHVIGIEVKAASTVGPDDFRGLRRIADRLGDDFLTGVVLYTGTSTLPFGDKLRAMPISALWQLPAPVED
jgi:uncharacterized protein